LDTPFTNFLACDVFPPDLLSKIQDKKGVKNLVADHLLSKIQGKHLHKFKTRRG